MDTNPVLYEQDYFAWTQEQAALIRQGKLADVDAEHLIEELEEMGNSQANLLINHLRILLAHLLKWQYQSHLRGRSWQATIKELRYAMQRRLAKNHSLKSKWDESVLDGYRLGVLLAVRETNLPEEQFPVDCPYTAEQIMAEDFWPE